MVGDFPVAVACAEVGYVGGASGRVWVWSRGTPEPQILRFAQNGMGGVARCEWPFDELRVSGESEVRVRTMGS